jgi:Asp-tRNA(Asn)/Glu-tRNA(Gln) amidotransferase A subunit family amidase
VESLLSREVSSISEAARLIERGELSPVELTAVLLRRIEQLNPHLAAFVTVCADFALQQARIAETEIQAGRYRGPLHGIPFGLKDIVNTKGILTSAHSKLGKDHVPHEDATVTSRLYAAGAVLLGKLATHEFAHGGPSFDLPWPPARNPWNTDHFTGGSSSGPASAVAAGLVLGAVGSDTGGSIRNPSSLCGIVGLKPTYGLISRYGVIPNSYSFDTCGPMTWTVDDCAIMLGAISGFDPKDSISVRRPPIDYRKALTGDIHGVRIGLVRHFLDEGLPVGDELRAAMENVGMVFRDLGAKVKDVRMRSLQDYYDVKIVIAEVELFNVHAHNLRVRAHDFGRDFLGRCLPACLITGSDYVDAQRERRVLVAESQSVFEQCDVLVTAGFHSPAPRIDAVRTVSMWEQPNMAVPFNIIGGPALSQCIGFSSNDLPLAMQVAGRPFGEETVLRVGHAYEKATSWRQRFPAVVPPTVKGPKPTETRSVDAGMKQQVADAAYLSGLSLSESQLDQVCEAAPHVYRMTARLRRQRKWREEPSSIFVFPRYKSE